LCKISQGNRATISPTINPIQKDSSEKLTFTQEYLAAASGASQGMLLHSKKSSFSKKCKKARMQTHSKSFETSSPIIYWLCINFEQAITSNTSVHTHLRSKHHHAKIAAIHSLSSQKQ